MHKNKKILFYVSEDWYFISHRLKLALFLQKKGYQINLCCKDTGRVKDILSYGIKWHNIEVKRKSLSFLQFLKEVIIFHNAINKIEPDLLHLISMRQIVVGTLAATASRCKNVYITFTGLGYLFTEKNIRSFLIRFLVGISIFITSKLLKAKAVVQNNDDKKYIIKKFHFNRDLITVIKGSGIDLKYYKIKPEMHNKKITISFVGRLLKDKGIHYLVEAFKQAKKEHNNLKLFLAGPLDVNNPSALSKKELNKILKIKHIHYLGNVKDVRVVWNKTNIAILLSKREGLPLSLIEAAATGRSIIATDVPGCREIAKNGFNSITVPYGDIKKTKDAIIKLAKNSDLRKKFSLLGRSLVEREMAQEIIFSEHLKIYEK